MREGARVSGGDAAHSHAGMPKGIPAAASVDDARRRTRAARWGVVRVLLKLLYPLIILSAWYVDSPRYIGLSLLILLWCQHWIGRRVSPGVPPRLTRVDWCVALTLSSVSATITFTDSTRLLHLYPALVNVGLLVAFAATLIRGPSMIERFARLRHPHLSEHAVRHTEHVTRVWCGFFVLNATVSAYGAFFWRPAAWALYNGVIVYGLIGCLLVGEMVWRRFVVMPRAQAS
jgi:uncharacterized membrane protein